MFVEGGVSCALKIDAQAAESVQDGVWVKWLSGAGSREEPRALSAGCGSEVRTVRKVLSKQVGEGPGNGRWVRAEGDPRVARSFVDLDGIGPEFGDSHERLGVEKKQDSGDAVGKRFARARQ